MSLGIKLAAQQKAELERIEREAVAATQAADAEQSRQTKIVEQYFENVRGTIASVINDGGKMPAFTIGKHGGWVCDVPELSQIMETYKNNFLSNLRDPYKFYSRIWMNFVDWAYENDLLVNMVNDGDGMGRESWFMIEVKPNANAF
jgi:hypothetical protein